MEWYLVPLTSHHEHPQMYPQADPHRRKIGFCLSVPTVLPTFHLSKSTCTQENPFYIRLLLTCFLLICHLSRTLPLTSYINPVNHSQQRYLSLQKKKKKHHSPNPEPAQITHTKNARSEHLRLPRPRRHGHERPYPRTERWYVTP